MLSLFANTLWSFSSDFLSLIFNCSDLSGFPIASSQILAVPMFPPVRPILLVTVRPVASVCHRLDPLHVQEVRVDREMISPGWAAPPDLAGIGFETK